MTDETTPTPEAAPQVPVASEVRTVTIPEPDQAESTPAAEGSEPANTEPEKTEEKSKRSASGRISELYAQRKQAEAEATVARQEADRLRGELAKLAERYADPNTTADEQEAIRLRHAVKSERADQVASEADIRAQAVKMKRIEAFHEKVESVRDRLPDFDDVVTLQTPISDVAAELIADSDVGPQIAYHLGKNLDLARRIASLPPHLQGAEIARIEAKVSVPVRKVTQAPPPAPRVGGGSSPAAKDPAQMSMADYSAWFKSRGAG